LIWNSWNDFVAMGGYGFYVWGSYAVTLGLMAVELIVLGQRRRRAAALAARAPARRRA
jgi:heme exporter protein D